MRVTKYTDKNVKARKKLNIKIRETAHCDGWTVTTYLIGFPEKVVVAPPCFRALNPLDSCP
jgi:hypothetical protein